MTLNYWHYIFLGVSLLIFLAGLIAALKQEDKKLMLQMLVSTTVISIFLAFFSLMVVDKYTKNVELFKVKNKRLLSTEQIVYTGMVKNTGDFLVGKVVISIKLVNKGHVTGNVKAGNFYKPKGIMDYFGGDDKEQSKPQTIVKKFVIARNLKAGTAKPFRVHFRFPGYFRSVAQFITVDGK